MATNTVTPAAPVAAETQEVDVQQSLDRATSKELKDWRLTGDLPKAKPPKSEPEMPSTEDSATSEEKPAVTRTDSASVPPQKKKSDAQDRIRELIRERDELKAKLAPPSVQPTSQPAAETKSPGNPEPQIDDVDPATGKPVHSSFKDWQSAHDKWNRAEAIREFGEIQGKTQREQQLAKAEEVISENFGKKVEGARKKYADFDTVALANDLPLMKGSLPDAFCLDSPHGADVLYYLGQHRDILKTNGNASGWPYVMTPLAMARELVKIEMQFSNGHSPTPSAPRNIPRLPEPPTEVSARRSAPVDEAESALARGDTAAYMRAMNARELKAARKG